MLSKERLLRILLAYCINACRAPAKPHLERECYQSRSQLWFIDGCVSLSITCQISNETNKKKKKENKKRQWSALHWNGPPEVQLFLPAWGNRSQSQVNQSILIECERCRSGSEHHCFDSAKCNQLGAVVYRPKWTFIGRSHNTNPLPNAQVSGDIGNVLYGIKYWYCKPGLPCHPTSKHRVCDVKLEEANVLHPHRELWHVLLHSVSFGKLQPNSPFQARSQTRFVIELLHWR